MGLVDSHCHVQHDAFDEDREEVIARSLDALDWFVIIGDDIAMSQRAADMARERVYATVAMHPHHADQTDAAALSAIRELAVRPGVVAIGEIGLDYHYMLSTDANQRTALERQLEIAVELEMPVVFHCREAEEDFLRVVEPFHRQLVGAVMHCFGGDAAFAQRCLDWGFHVSFAGNVTFPKAPTLRDAAKIVPLERLLVETDSPYLAPQPVRGKRCEPLFVQHTARFLADLKGVSLEAFAEATTRNAERFYRIRRLSQNT
jgi:TatD DNase family protein